jgi:hypothetical protein
MAKEIINITKDELPFGMLMEQQYEIRRPALAGAQTRELRKKNGFNNQKGKDNQKLEQLAVAGNG